MSFSASNSIWPIVSIYIPCPNPSAAFPMMPQQMPDTEVESEQLFPLLHCCIILHNLLSFSLPSPPSKRKNPPLPPTLACSGSSACSLSLLSGPLISCEGPVYCLARGGGRWRAWAPRGAWPGCALPMAGARSRGRALLPSQDPFIALSAVNLSALHDAFTSFFICSGF